MDPEFLPHPEGDSTPFPAAPRHMSNTMNQYHCRLVADDPTEGLYEVNVTGGPEGGAAVFVTDNYWDSGSYDVLVTDAIGDTYRVTVDAVFEPQVHTSKAVKVPDGEINV